MKKKKPKQKQLVQHPYRRERFLDLPSQPSQLGSKRSADQKRNTHRTVGRCIAVSQIHLIISAHKQGRRFKHSFWIEPPANSKWPKHWCSLSLLSSHLSLIYRRKAEVPLLLWVSHFTNLLAVFRLYFAASQNETNRKFIIIIILVVPARSHSTFTLQTKKIQQLGQ